MNATAHADSPVMDIDLARLAGNWRTVRGRYTGNDLGAVVKCNAYGLGLEPVVNTLSAQGCLQYWALGYDEACRVRALAPAAEVFILNGLRGASARDFAYATLNKPAVPPNDDATAEIRVITMPSGLTRLTSSADTPPIR